jgi:hypothetical protein
MQLILCWCLTFSATFLYYALPLGFSMALSLGLMFVLELVLNAVLAKNEIELEHFLSTHQISVACCKGFIVSLIVKILLQFAPTAVQAILDTKFAAM